MKLLYCTTTALKVQLTEEFNGSLFSLWFAEEFNPACNPPSSNPFHIFKHWAKTFEANDIADKTYQAHIAAMRNGSKRRLKGTPVYKDARDLIRNMGIHGIRPVLGIVEVDEYVSHGKVVERVQPANRGSATSLEYQLNDVRGPKLDDPELHLHQLY
jgi:hypothetical protein